MTKPAKIMLGILAVIILGTAIGIGSTPVVMKIVYNIGTVKNGPWRTNPNAGSRQANMYMRAGIALGGFLALNQSEAIYYSASTDDGGQTFSGDNIYRIEGKPPETLWWSITAYDADGRLIPNELERYSYNGNNVIVDRDGKFTIYISKTPKPGNWLPLENRKKFTLGLRLYNPGEAIRKSPATVALPNIIKEGGK